MHRKRRPCKGVDHRYLNYFRFHGAAPGSELWSLIAAPPDDVIPDTYVCFCCLAVIPSIGCCCCSGELYPCETDVRLCEELETGDEVEVDMEADVLTVLASGKQHPLKPIGDVRPLH